MNLNGVIGFFFIFLCLFKNGNTLSKAEGFCKDYMIFCKEAAFHDDLFTSFRAHPTIIMMIENVRYDESMLISKCILEKYPFFENYYSKICEEDKIGRPIQFNYSSIGLLSPTALRYIKIAGDILNEFGSLNSFRILEIGGGYGGQCKILHNLSGFASYTNIDLPNCLYLFSKYTNFHKITDLVCIENTNLKDISDYDLLISNYAFSEIDVEEQLHYIELVINKIPRGYITYNNANEDMIKSLSVDGFVNLLSKEGRLIKVEPENPSTGFGNFLITWKPI
jgi:putative sugar O-methyltransferase